MINKKLLFYSPVLESARPASEQVPCKRT